MNTPPLLDVEDLSVTFDTEAGRVRAVDGVSFSLARGETVALVGESGCGKSTVARAVMGLVRPAAGTVRFEGTALPPLGAAARRPFLEKLQMVFQDPDASLNPRLSIAASVAEPFEIREGSLPRAARQERVGALFESVGLDRALLGRYPHELSGGQKQRVCLARALATNPSLVVLDEAVSALDVSIQAQILNLLADLRDRFGLAYLFITHDLRVVRHLASRVLVMYLGQIVESASTDALFSEPRHPYTRTLLASVPTLGADRAARLRVRGEVPSPLSPPSGCRFHPRCPEAFERCPKEAPALYATPHGGTSRCFLSER